MLQALGDLQSFNRYAYCYSNPLTCTDPSGNSALSKLWHKIWHNPVFKIVIVVSVASITGGFALEAYATSMAATSGYASAAAAEAAAAAAGADTALVASAGGAYTSAYVAAATSITGGAIQGAAAGFAGAFVGSGGNVKAGLQGAATGAVLGGVAMGVSDFDPVTRVGAKAAASGLMARVQGGDGLRALGVQIATGTSAELFRATVGWSASPGSGENRICEAEECADISKSNFYKGTSIPQNFKNVNVIGLNISLADSDYIFFAQSGPLSRVLNFIPGMNATAQFHDSIFLPRPDSFNIFSNITTMLPAASISYGALLDTVPVDRERCPREGLNN